MPDEKRTEPMPRYDRERWLEAALNALAEEGGARLRVDALAKRLGVTKGSFYHHFLSRDDFISAVADYWAQVYKDDVIAHVEERGGDGLRRIRTLIQTIGAGGYDRYDIAFRSWAAQDANVAKRMRIVDEHRYVFLLSVFADRLSGIRQRATRRLHARGELRRRGRRERHRLLHPSVGDELRAAFSAMPEAPSRRSSSANTSVQDAPAEASIT